MKNVKLILLILCLLIFKLNLSFASNLEHVVWDQKPIDIILPINQEKMITFPGSIQFGYNNQALSSEQLRIQNNNGTLYLTAYQTFKPIRVAVKLVENTHIILLNLSAGQQGDANPVDIVFHEEKRQSNLKDKQGKEVLNPIQLIRFAENQLFAKSRYLINSSTNFVVPMHTTKTVPLILDGQILSTPIRSWSDGEYFVTAVTLHNLTSSPINLSPHLLCGDWEMAAFFPVLTLAPEENYSDTTTVFLLSVSPFASAIASCAGFGG